MSRHSTTKSGSFLDHARANGDFATLTRVIKAAPHGSNAGWHSGCHCARCRRAHSDDQRTRGRGLGAAAAPSRGAATAPGRDLRRPAVRAILRDLGLPSNQVWGLTRTDQEWSKRLEAALTATRRDDLHPATAVKYSLRRPASRSVTGHAAVGHVIHWVTGPSQPAGAASSGGSTRA